MNWALVPIGVTVWAFPAMTMSSTTPPGLRSLHGAAGAARNHMGIVRNAGRKVRFPSTTLSGRLAEMLRSKGPASASALTSDAPKRADRL